MTQIEYQNSCFRKIIISSIYYLNIITSFDLSVGVLINLKNVETFLVIQYIYSKFLSAVEFDFIC